MSYRDLEAAIAAQLAQHQAELAEKAQAAGLKAAQKAFRARRNKRGTRDLPQRVYSPSFLVTLALTPAKPVPLSQWQGKPADWASQTIVKQFTVVCTSTLVAELEARRQALAQGLLWRETLCVKQQED